MTIGTKSVLFGAHQFLIHPWFVAAAWCKLYGFPWDPRLWVAFFVHDLGYLGKPDMDGAEGEAHVFLGARIMGNLFDDGFFCLTPWLAKFCDLIFGHQPEECDWYCFSFYHSRFMAKRYCAQFTRLCVADKLATCLMPFWLYLPLVNLTGEIHEYMGRARHKEGEKYAAMGIDLSQGKRVWFASMCDYMRRWVAAHSDGSDDTWTPSNPAADPLGHIEHRTIGSDPEDEGGAT